MNAIRIRYTFKRKADGHIWQEITPIECLEGKGDKPFVLKAYEPEWDLVGRDLSLNLFDKNNKEVFGNDIVEGYWHWMKGDGYLRKGTPDKIRKWFKIYNSNGRRYSAGWALDEICVHPDDRKFAEQYFYRSVQTNLREDRECFLKDNEVIWKGINEDIEIIGDVYVTPELLER